MGEDKGLYMVAVDPAENGYIVRAQYAEHTDSWVFSSLRPALAKVKELLSAKDEITCEPQTVA